MMLVGGFIFTWSIFLVSVVAARPMIPGLNDQNAEELGRYGLLFHFIRIAVIVLMFGFILGSIYVHNRKRCREKDQLLDDIEVEQKVEKKAPTEEASEGWERDSDWWKKQG